MGIGWLDRDPAFEFKSCLNEYIRYVDRSNIADNLHKEHDYQQEEGLHMFQSGESNDSDEEGESNSSLTTTAAVGSKQKSVGCESQLDLAIKPGSKITIKSLGIHRTILKHHVPTEASEATPGTNLPLPPPPTADGAQTNSSQTQSTISNTGIIIPPPRQQQYEEEKNISATTDWGDFETA